MNDTTHKSSRSSRWWSFIIRDVLWLTVVVALLATRWAENRRLESARAAAVAGEEAIQRKNGELHEKHQRLKISFAKMRDEANKKFKQEQRLAEAEVQRRVAEMERDHAAALNPP